jgi:hypothetical protein
MLQLIVEKVTYERLHRANLNDTWPTGMGWPVDLEPWNKVRLANEQARGNTYPMKIGKGLTELACIWDTILVSNGEHLESIAFPARLCKSHDRGLDLPL